MLDEVVAALGRRRRPDGTLRARRRAESVTVERIVGSLARHGDFDRYLQPLREEVRAHRDQLAHADSAGVHTPVSLVQVGEIYFVEDGHHRISLARARGQIAVDAEVRSLCTIAWACACLTRAALDVKAAERDFLVEVDLSDPALRDLWLADPAGYQNLALAARSWTAHATHDCVETDCVVDNRTAAAWWDLEVLPRAAAIAAARPGESAASRYLRSTNHDRGWP